MSRRLWQPSYLAVLTLALGYAVARRGGTLPLDWNVSLLLLGLAAIAYWSLTPRSKLAPSPGAWLTWTALLVPAYVALQLAPLPYVILSFVSPARARTLDSLAHVMQTSAFSPLSVAAGITVSYLFRTIGYTVMFFLVRDIAWRSWQRKSWAAVIPLLGIAAVEGGLGLLQNASGVTVEGTYDNKNHFAGLLEMVLPFFLAYAAVLIHRERSGERSRPSPPFVRWLKAGVVLSLGALVFAGLLYSLSKTGFVAAIFGLFIASTLAIRTVLQGRQKWLAWSALLVGALVVVVFFPPDELVNGYGQLVRTELATGEGRVPIWANTLHLIRDYPLFGSGLGTFATAFLKYQTAVVDRDFSFAHNDYLELMSELGAAGVLILGGLMIGIVIQAYRAATRGPDRNTRYLGLACVGAMAAIGFHSLADFNMYIPANALLLAWISGVAASAPSTSSRPVSNGANFRNVAMALACLLAVYAPAWIVFETSYRDDPHAEKVFCRFGVCDADAAATALIKEYGENAGEIPAGELIEQLRRDPVAPNSWADLGEAMQKAGRGEQARYCFDAAVSLGGNDPPLQLRAANYYYNSGERVRALAQTVSVLETSETYDGLVFQWYKDKNLTVTEILSHGLPRGPRAPRAFLRDLTAAGNAAGAAEVWPWSVAHGYTDEKLAREYVDFLVRGQQYEEAARSLTLFLGDRRNGYLETDWLYNGDFEMIPSGMFFDWRMDHPKGVTTELDSSVARSGTHSLRIRFDGTDNVNLSQVTQTAFVVPGSYRFEAYVRTQGITTDRGIGFHVWDPEGSGPVRVDAKTEELTGTNDWKKTELTIRVPREGRLITIGVTRQPSLKFDNQISGTAWIDSLKLVRVGEK